jgi:hypothetical protein
MKTVKPASCEKTPVKNSGRGRVFKLGIGVVAGVCITALVWHIGQDGSYSVETDLVYVSGNRMAGNVPDLSLSREAQILENPKVTTLIAGEIFGAEPRVATSREKAAQAPGREPLLLPYSPGYTRFGNAEQFRKWLSEGLSREVEVSPGMARVALRLRGDDPDFLVSVLTSYVSEYIDYRRSLEAGEKNTQATTATPDRKPSPEGIKADPVSEELLRLDSDQKTYENALRLIDTKKGAFAGFIPDNIRGISFLSRLQNRIVQMEINKTALLAKYTPEAREIRAIDEEIQDLRNELRAAIAELVKFSENRRGILLAVKANSNSSVAKTSEPEIRSRGLASNQAPDIGAAFIAGDGMCVFWQRPFITRKPLPLRLREYKDKLSSYL